MKHIFNQYSKNETVILIKNEIDFQRTGNQSDNPTKYYTIVWNRGNNQKVLIDNIAYDFTSNTILPIMMSQTFKFERSQDLVIWQFNREFYCVVDHDSEVGCVGFVFYGPSQTMFIKLYEEDIIKMQKLLEVFEDEFESEEDIKGGMLRMLLVRLIINITRLAKKQYLGTEEVNEEKFNLIRQFNMLVERHFRKEHQVSFYANLLHKSPKTVANTFSLYNKKTPLQTIHERIITEAKRLFYFTDKSVKEIADDLGFEDAAHFSKFFKNYTSINPSELRKTSQQSN
ncbi:transcriptional regulator [Emticicia aquatilis]|uniref:Transcriptional regulator n=1 Tax=Emticicia aquatilis TaxID=1537369 RepID=A0A917DYT3_9BACT|nr:helix-turn-helix domain-containing protein [Emticicia aquatilis]GGD79689.1 transcriptional regulator [Emticicia aquatilis]